MAESSWPTPDNTHAVTDSAYEQLATTYVASGLIGVPTMPCLAYADSSGRQIKLINSRHGSIRGFHWTSGATDVTKPTTTNTSGSARVDRLVLGLNRSTWNITSYVKAGTPGSGTPPTLQQDLGVTGIYEIPVARIAVANGYTTLNPGDVTNEAYYLGPPPLLVDSVARPAPAVGQLIFEADTGNSYIGTGSAFGSVLEDTGWMDCGVGSGYHVSSAKIRRVNGVAHMAASWQRFGGNVAAHTAHVVGTVPAGMYPTVRIPILAYLDGANLVVGHVDPSGGVYLDAFYATIATNAFVTVASASWPVG